MAKQVANDPLFGGTPPAASGDGEQREQQGEQSALPEGLRGKTPEEIYAAMNEEHNRVVNETVTNITRQFSQQRQQEQPPQNVPQRYAQPPHQQQQTSQEEPPDQMLDPDGFMDYQFRKRLTPILEQQTAIARGQNRNLFQQRLGEEGWKKYGAEVEQFMNGLHPQIQAHPDAYQRAYDIVLSSHRDEIVEEESSKRTLATVTKVLASMGQTPDQITETLKAVAEGTSLQSLAQQSQETAQQNFRQSLFQGNVGVRPMVDPLKTSVQSAYPKASPTKKKERHQDAIAVMEAFGMNEKEYEEYESLNTDLVSQINRGEV